jgi:hypothetical protein
VQAKMYLPACKEQPIQASQVKSLERLPRREELNKNTLGTCQLIVVIWCEFHGASRNGQEAEKGKDRELHGGFFKIFFECLSKIIIVIENGVERCRNQPARSIVRVRFVIVRIGLSNQQSKGVAVARGRTDPMAMLNA